MHVPTLIERKRDGGLLSRDEIAALVAGLVDGSVPEYQWSALAMAIYFRGMTPEETWDLTRGMRDSGGVLQHPAGHPPVVDKHSTGGVGDKVSLVLAPLLACCGVWVPMVSGRGLGITGGTLDKLESIPGFRTALTDDEMRMQLQQLGVFMAGQSANFCPADRKLYALRDVTGTVPSQHLIVASIMSKKLAENLDRLVLDVKFGTGAFMKTRPEAESLAAAMERVGGLAGVAVKSILTPMSEPLGLAVGNALEVRESVECLQGRGPADLEDLTLDLAMAVVPQSREELAAMLRDGRAWQKFQALVAAQRGSAEDLEKVGHSIHAAPCVVDLAAPNSGTIRRCDALAFGQATVLLGGGRAKASDAVDFAVGFDQILKAGAQVATGDPLCRIHARSQRQIDEVLPLLLSAYEIS